MLTIKIEVTRKNAERIAQAILPDGEFYEVWSAIYDAHLKFAGTESCWEIHADIERLMTDMAYEILKAEEISPPQHQWVVR